MLSQHAGRRRVQAVAGELPFTTACSDAAMATLTVHHGPDLGQALAEMRRVARTCGSRKTWGTAPEACWKPSVKSWGMGQPAGSVEPELERRRSDLATGRWGRCTVTSSTPRPSTRDSGSSWPGTTGPRGLPRDSPLGPCGPRRGAPLRSAGRHPGEGSPGAAPACWAGVSLPHSSGESGACRLSTLYARGRQNASKTIELLGE